MSIIRSTEAVTVATCPFCKGSVMFCLTSFMDKADQEDALWLMQKGFTVINTTLARARRGYACTCPTKAFVFSPTDNHAHAA